MASLSTNSNTNQSPSFFTLTNAIKLDRSYYTIWKSQILSSVRANGLEGFLNGTKICPDQLLTQEIESYGVENAVGESSADRSQENPAFVAWKR